MPPLPAGFCRQMEQLMGAQAASLLASLEAEATTGVRLNGRKQTGAHAVADTLQAATGECPQPVEWCRSGLRLARRPAFTLMPGLHAGAFYVQDPSSMITRTVVGMLADKLMAGRTSAPALLDLCAAPGGKTTAAIDALPDGSVVVANEFEPARVGALRTNLMRWGYPNVAVTCGSGALFAAMPGMFDIVMTDVPCSGEGMMRKEPEARRQWNEALVKQCATLQREIADAAVEALRPGGYLVYSTCTFNEEENEQQVRYLIDTYGLTPIGIRTALVGSAGEGVPAPALGGVEGMRFMPHITRGEGLFMAVLQKPADAPFGAAAPFSQPRAPKSKGKQPPAHKDLAARMLAAPDDFDIEASADKLVAMPKALRPYLAALPKKARLVAAGVELGTIKGKDFVPSHALAMSLAYRRGSFPEVEVDEATAVNYLRRQPLILKGDAARGFVLLTFDGLSLGWAKNIGSRANNLYPKELGIKFL